MERRDETLESRQFSKIKFVQLRSCHINCLQYVLRYSPDGTNVYGSRGVYEGIWSA